MVMLGEQRPMRLQQERVPVVAVGLRKCAVDGDGLAAALDGRFTFLDLDWNVPVDDQALNRVRVELSEDLLAEPRFVNQRKVRVLRFMIRTRRDDEIALEGGNPVLAEERRLRSAPKVPEHV